jgi:hypothetical protein
MTANIGEIRLISLVVNFLFTLTAGAVTSWES